MLHKQKGGQMKKILMILPLALILCFTFSCQDKEAAAELEAIKAKTEIEEQNKELVLRFYEELDKQNFEAGIALLSPDAKIYASGGFEPAKPEDLKYLFPVWFTAFPDYAHTIEDVIAKGDKVVLRIIYTGTHKGDFLGAPPTGNSFKYLGIHIITVKDGKVVEAWILEDMLYLMQQIGMELKQKQGEK
jgi:steroid delta-isomerase-like uncharacterized protein